MASLSLSPLFQIYSTNGYLHPSPSPTRLKHSSETPENDAISYSDAESDSGFESGTHASCISETISGSHSESAAVGKSEDSESDEDERIEKAILHLDVKVCVRQPHLLFVCFGANNF